MNINIKKIKVSKGKMLFEYEKNEEDHISTHTSRFEEAPEPSFFEALSRLKNDICVILELDPEQYASRIIPTGVTYSTDSAGYDAAIITCEYRIPQSKLMTTINTPLFKFLENANELGLTGYFSKEIAANLRALQREAVRYLLGHRGQGSLFDGDEHDVDQNDSPTNIIALNGGMKQIAG